MVAEVPTVEVYAGDTVTWPTYTFKNADGTVRNLDAEGWAAWRAQWRARPDAETAIDLTVDYSSASVGLIKISASSTATEAMRAAGVWDLQAVNASIIKTWLRGKTRWIQDITRG